MKNPSLLLLTITFSLTFEYAHTYRYYSNNNVHPHGYRFRRRLRFRRVPPPSGLRPDLVPSWPDESTYEAMHSNIYRQTMDYFTEKFEKNLPLLIEDEVRRRSQQNSRGMDANFGGYSSNGRGENVNEYGSRQNKMEEYGTDQEINQSPNEFGSENQDYSAERMENQNPEGISEIQRPEGDNGEAIADYEAKEPQALNGKLSEGNSEYPDERNSGESNGNLPSDYDGNGNSDDRSFQVDKILEPEPLNSKSSAIFLGNTIYFSLLLSAFAAILQQLVHNV